jgi:hypothetical protein
MSVDYACPLLNQKKISRQLMAKLLNPFYHRNLDIEIVILGFLKIKWH